MRMHTWFSIARKTSKKRKTGSRYNQKTCNAQTQFEEAVQLFSIIYCHQLKTTEVPNVCFTSPTFGGGDSRTEAAPSAGPAYRSLEPRWGNSTRPEQAKLSSQALIDLRTIFGLLRLRTRLNNIEWYWIIFTNFRHFGNFLICFRKFDWKATDVTLFWNLSRNPDKIHQKFAEKMQIRRSKLKTSEIH